MPRSSSLPGPGGAGDARSHDAALAVVAEQLATAVRTRKCWPCGCLHDAINGFATSPWADTLRPILEEGRSAAKAREYDCLGCAVCYPAVAINAIADADPDLAESIGCCPTSPPVERFGWPPLPGDYRTLRYDAPVAACTLNAPDLMEKLAAAAVPGLGIVGTLRTENLGIERIVQNVVSNPHLRFMFLCGEDTEGAIGHLPGRSFLALATNGVDDRGRIIGAPGRRPILKNARRELVEAFRQRVEVIDLIGESDSARIVDLVAECVARDPGPCAALPTETRVRSVAAEEPATLVLDSAGYVVVHASTATEMLVAEHYTTQGVLDCIVEGATPSAVVGALIDRELITRMEHAAYLGQELARAERALRDGARYVQDRAPGSGAGSSCTGGGGCGGDGT